MFHLPARRVARAPPPRMGDRDRQAETAEDETFPRGRCPDQAVADQTEAPDGAHRREGPVPPIARSRAPPNTRSQVPGPQQKERHEPEEEQADGAVDRRQQETRGDSASQRQNKTAASEDMAATAFADEESEGRSAKGQPPTSLVQRLQNRSVG